MWNEFVANAKNATFLFHRDFMEYHQDRFDDFSLMVFDEKNKLKAILPANRVGNILYSHQGLTYGGIVFEKNHNPINTSNIIDSILVFLKEALFTTIFIKSTPIFYHKSNAAELDYFLFQKGATIENREMNLAIDLRKDWKLSKSKLKHFKKVQTKLDLVEEFDFNPFWSQVLTPRLFEKYDTKPVHTLDEILYLKEKFSTNIIQYSAYFEGEIVAGITIFKNDKVVKSQYGAITKVGEKLRALDFLFISLIEKYKNQDYFFFDMGTVLHNEGLLNQKIELGCDVFTNDHYSLKI